jgi:hypothetical protein
MVIICIMAKRLFFLGTEGWFEMDPELAGALEINAKTYDDLIGLAYRIMNRHGYRNYMISENPDFIATGRILIKSIVADHVS